MMASSSTIFLLCATALPPMVDCTTIPAYNHPPIIKVPTYRLYRGKDYIDEIVGRAEGAAFHRLLTSNIRKHATPTRSIPPGGTSDDVLEVDSFEHLEHLMAEQSDRMLMMEFYGSWCVACKAMTPLFSSLPYIYRPYSSHLLFCRGEIKRFPQLIAQSSTAPVVEDKTIDVQERLDGCARCQGTGLIECHECHGKGHVLREVSGKQGMIVVADFCPSCTGKKKMPCPVCGGKCYMCD